MMVTTLRQLNTGNVRATCFSAAQDMAYKLAVTHVHETMDGFKDKSELEKEVLAINLASHTHMWRPFYERFMSVAGVETDGEEDDGDAGDVFFEDSDSDGECFSADAELCSAR
jgi:hypothetical protein